MKTTIMDISNLAIPKGGKMLKSKTPGNIVFRLDDRNLYAIIFLAVTAILLLILTLCNLIFLMGGIHIIVFSICAIIYLIEYITVTITPDNTLKIRRLNNVYRFNIELIDDIFVEIVNKPRKQYLFIKYGSKDFRILTNSDFDNLKFIELLLFEIKGWKIEEDFE